jgi:hypothetical protein
MRAVLLKGVDPSEAASELRNRSIGLAGSSTVVAGPQAPHEPAAVLEAIAEWAEPLGPDELDALIGSEGIDLAHRVIRWGEILGLITSDPSGAWKLDPVLASAISMAK